MANTTGAKRLHRRCYHCFRPNHLCFCDSIPTIANRTEILILQHVGEKSHRFNTARIVKLALQNCELAVDHNKGFTTRPLAVKSNAGLLYPGTDAPLLADLTPSERPSQLVIVDGTWHQAKTIYRDVHQLHQLPCFRLRPATPGQYRIRREPDEFSLSTLEATVAALRALEPTTTGLDELLAAFDRMVTSQIAERAGKQVRRQKVSRSEHLRFLPRALLADPTRLVVMYGEAMPSVESAPQASRQPISWHARRYQTPDRFSQLLVPSGHVSSTSLEHFRLSRSDFKAAVTHAQFLEKWRQFTRPNDIFVVYHQRTFQLLQAIEPLAKHCHSLKSIFSRLRQGAERSSFQSLESLAELEGVPIPNSTEGTRAHYRLELAERMLAQLRTEHARLDC